MTDPIANRNQYALAALKEQRALHAGQLTQLENQARLKREALSHIDAVLKLFAPEIDPDAIPARRARKGMPIRSTTCLAASWECRRRAEPMPSCDVIDAIVAEMAFPEDATALVGSRVRHGLKHVARRENGPVLKSGSRGDALWSLR